MKKIDRRKSYYLILDTETANSLEQPLVYDLGFAVIDKKGKIYEEKSFLIYDVFYLMSNLMKSAYYAEKIPLYKEKIKNKKIQTTNFLTARRLIYNLCKEYNVKAIIAHFAIFDSRALNTTLRYLTKSKNRFFLPYGIPLWCTKNMAEDTICKQKTYIEFCRRNNLLVKGNKASASAENLYKYISGQKDFKEEHTGLEDVKIEVQIFAWCMKQKKKMRKRAWVS